MKISIARVALRNVEATLRRKDGRLIVVLDSATAVTDAGGEVIHYEGTLTEITRFKRAQEIQSVLLRIFLAAGAASDLYALLTAVHRELSELLDTSNFYIALYHEETGLYSFPFHVDEREPDEQPPQRLENSLTDYVRRTGRPLLADEQTHRKLTRQGEVELVGVAAPIWLGVPLRSGDQLLGVVAVQSYRERSLYTQEDLDLLTFVSENIGFAIERKHAEVELQASEKRFRDLFEASPDAIFVEDIEGNVLDANPAAAKLQGIDAERLIGMNVKQLVPPDEAAEVLARHRRLVLGEEVVVEALTWTANGHSVPVEVRSSPLEYAGGPAALIQVRDVTERKEHEKRLEYLARFDALTGLPNRFLFEDRLRQAIVAARRSGERIALHYLDLDEFKQVNDTLGHSIGDRLLEAAGQRLTTLVRESDTVARLGGDEFAIIQVGIDSATGATAFAIRILEAMLAPFRLGQNEVQSSTSIGIALSTLLEDPEDLQLQADRALYKAKEKGRGSFHFHDEKLAQEVQEYVSVRQDLDGAIERGEFFLEYQPQIDLKSGAITGCEALVRWRHPSRGLLPPGAFISVTEKTGLIIPIGAWVLREACRQRRQWCDSGLPQVPVAVNLSAVQFRDPRFSQRLHEVLEKTGIRPGLLELELTETLLMQGPEGVQGILQDSHESGVSIAIDDFGTGYSSLQYLREFPVGKLKIAMEFVQGVTSNTDDAAIVAAVISLGHQLGMTVIAEGVETEEQADFLKKHGCDEAQGFLFSRPVSAETFAKKLGQP